MTFTGPRLCAVLHHRSVVRSAQPQDLGVLRKTCLPSPLNTYRPMAWALAFFWFASLSSALFSVSCRAWWSWSLSLVDFFSWCHYIDVLTTAHIGREGAMPAAVHLWPFRCPVRYPPQVRSPVFITQPWLWSCWWCGSVSASVWFTESSSCSGF